MGESTSEVRAAWRKSSFSDPSDCVEVRLAGSGVQLRDSKNPSGPVLEFTEHEWTAFVRGVFNREFDL